MAIQVELAGETETQLAAAARAQGLAPEKYAGSLLQQALASGEGGSGRLTLDELQTMLNEIAKGAEDLPVLLTSSLTRESFYEYRS